RSGSPYPAAAHRTPGPARPDGPYQCRARERRGQRPARAPEWQCELSPVIVSWVTIVHGAQPAVGHYGHDRVSDLTWDCPTARDVASRVEETRRWSRAD